MIDNPQPLKQAQHHIHWWQKIKAILFGQWLLAKEENERIHDTLKLVEFDKQFPLKSSFKDWIQAIDTIQPLVQSHRKSIEPSTNDEFDLDLLAANTYLFHLERLLVKIREYLHQYRFRQEQYVEQNFYSYKLEINQATNAAEQCYFTILQLTALLQRHDGKKYSDEMVAQIHALELDTTALGSAIRSLNQSAYKAESMAQLASIEQDLLQSLSRPVSTAVFANNNLNFNLPHSQGEFLRLKAKSIEDPENGKFIINLIDIHDQLKKCYVVARKVFIKDSLDQMGVHIEGIIEEFSKNESNKNIIFEHLNQLFHSVESIRFNTNRESRCSKNLFVRSKEAMKSLRKICQKHPIGLEYIREYTIKRDLLKLPKG